MSPPALSDLDRARFKAYRRLIPIVFLAYVIAYVDRTNVSVAGLTMARDLGFDMAVFGTGSGIFFLGYFLLEIPGSLLVERWSARKWISRIMISWGLVAAGTALVKTPGQFYGIRFCLGLAEAGFFPGVIVYLTHWFPQRDRARALSFFFLAGPVAGVVGPLLAKLALGDGRADQAKLFGLAGWQWVYVAWGIPAVLMGLFILLALTDRPAQARWLTTGEREALEAELAREKALHDPARHLSVWKALSNPRVLLLALAYFFAVTGNYGVEFFMPKIVQSWYGLNLASVTWLVTIPPVAMGLGILLVGWSSDRRSERWAHTYLPICLGGVSVLLAALVQGHLALTVLFFSLTYFGIRGYLGPFWSLPSLFLQGAAAAGSIGLINSVGNLGGFVGPYVMGRVEKLTGSFQGGLVFLAVCDFFAAGIIVLLAARYRRTSDGRASVPAAAIAADQAVGSK